MRQVFGWASAVVMAVVLSGCATTEFKGPCGNCTYGYATVKKSTERHAFCVVNGKQVDCTKSPAECPECAKHGTMK
jgi:hypothetical protein